jgi:hypothetical protein
LRKVKVVARFCPPDDGSSDISRATADEGAARVGAHAHTRATSKGLA